MAPPPADSAFEEGRASGPGAKEHDRRVRESLQERDLGELAEAVERDVSSKGVSFGSAGGDEAFRIDPLPRLIDEREWSELAAGLD